MPRGSGTGSPSTCSSHGQAGAADLVDQRVEAVEARLRARARRSLAVACASRRAGGASRRARCGRPARRPCSASRSSVELGGQLVPHGADLEHHHADRVGDDVVQLARDPGALLGDGDPRRRLALALGLGGALLGRLGLLGALAQGEAGEPGDARTAPG